MRTPVSKKGMKLYDHLPPEEAILRAWVIEGGAPGWHREMKSSVRQRMPLLGRALDRLAKENGYPRT